MRPKSSLPPSRKPAHVARGPAAHEIRIIGGQWRRTLIKVLDKPGLRPTPELVRQLQLQAERLKATGLQVQRSDAVAGMQRLTPGAFDLVFLDPPFDGPWFEPALQAAVRLVPVGGWVYLEAPSPWVDEALAPLGLEAVRHLKAGAVHAHLLRRTA